MEEALDLSFDRLLMMIVMLEWTTIFCNYSVGGPIYCVIICGSGLIFCIIIWGMDHYISEICTGMDHYIALLYAWVDQYIV